MFQIIVDCVAQPGNGSSQGLLRFLNVKKTFFECERSHVWTTSTLGVSECFVNEEYLNAFGTKVPVYRLQTGDVSNERWSGQASKNEHGVFAFRTAQWKLLSVFIVDCHVRHLLPDF